MSASRDGKSKREEFRQEDILQAVVIADSFNVRFAPLTDVKPRALLPVVSQPILDYTLEFLSSAGIEQIIVFCRNHAHQIKKHIHNFTGGKNGKPCEILTVVSETCLSMGDALRELDALGMIRNDFVLVNGDLVANINLKEILEEHKARRLREKTPVMTLVFREAPPNHKTRCKEENVFLAMLKDKQRVVHHQRVRSSKTYRLPLELFQEHAEVELCNNLLDCQVSMCSVSVPMLFTENFDYQTRDDFVKGILDNMEILGNTVHIHIVKDKYAARVSNLSTYDSVSQDIISRWSYPLVPNCSARSECDNKTYGRHNVYCHKDVTLARGCTLKQNVVIGKGSSIGSGATISHSVIGKNCHIGENVSLDHSYIWDDVCIENNCVINSSIVADKAVIKQRVTVERGCILSYGVIVGPDCTVKSRSVLMSTPPELDTDSEAAKKVDHSLVGAEGVAYEYEADSDSEGDSVLDYLGNSEEEEESESEESDQDSESLPATPPPDDSKLFFDEVLGTLERAGEENITVENMVLEVNSLKHAYGIQIKEVNQLLTKAILYIPLQTDQPPSDPPKYLNHLKLPFKQFLALLKNYIKSEASQLDCLESLEELAGNYEVVKKSVVNLLKFFYDKDILSEEAILKWHQNPSATADPSHIQGIRKETQPFIDWLEEAEEESEED